MNHYLCDRWQGFIQQTVFLIGRGYHFHCLAILPEKKKERWDEIDKKLIGKYQADKSKFQRARQKQKGTTNFFYLRWDNLALILHTKGVIADGIAYDDRFLDVRDKPLTISISENITLLVYVENGKVSVKLEKESYRGFKACIEDVCKLKDKRTIIREFDKINGLPAFSGIIDQKRRLATFTAKQAKKHQVDLSPKELRVNTRRKIFKVFA